MKQYLDFMRHVRDNGVTKTDRTGTGTRSVFGYQMRFDLSQGFPLVTTKKIHIKSVIHELLWMLAGDTNVKYLNDNGVTIWDEWQDENGSIGAGYGYQWRSWPDYNGGSIDQISQVIEQLKTDPDSRRLIVSAWNVADLPNMKLPPCHAFFQFYTEEMTLSERLKAEEAFIKCGDWSGAACNARGWKSEDWEGDALKVHTYLDQIEVPRRRLSCQLYQRSADVLLGVPFNIASYALLTHMIAQQVGMVAGEFIWTGGDCHLYENHIEQAREQLSRQPFDLPHLNIKRKPDSIFDYQFDDFEIVGYECHPHIKAPVAV